MKLIILNEEPTIRRSDTNYCNLQSLDNAMNAAYEEVIISDQLDFVQDKEVPLAKLISKLKYGAKISLSGVDALELSRKLIYGDISLVDWNNIVYSRAGLMCMEDIVRYFNQFKLTITKKRLVNETFFVEARRDAKK